MYIGNNIITENLILNLDPANPKSYSGEGQNWLDLSSNKIDGVLTNNPIYNEEYKGIFSLNGVDNYINTNVPLDPIAYGLFSDNNSQWSVSSWFSPDITKLTPSVITSKSDGIDINCTYVVWVEGTNLFVRLRGGNILTITDSLRSAWNEVTITWDGTIAKAYLNGKYINDINVGTAPIQNENFCIGASDSGLNSQYKGDISIVKVYNKALSNEEVIKNYNATKSRFILIKVFDSNPDPEVRFVFTVKTDNPGTSGNNQFTLPAISGADPFDVDFGDGTIINGLVNAYTHTYSTPGTYEIKINNFNRFWFRGGGDRRKMLNISNWGNCRITLRNAFHGCNNLTSTATDAPIIETTSLTYCFYQCTVFNGVVNNWDTSGVTEMFGVFREALAFNQPLDNWDTSNVTNMERMFQATEAFNQDLNSWDTSKVTNMRVMFYQTKAFNGQIGNWNTSLVNDMEFMFGYSEAFNQPIGNWDVSNITSMRQMFRENPVFNQPLDNWNTSLVNDMEFMFGWTNAFNQDLNGWDTSNVTNMYAMFYQTKAFNGAIGNWNTSSATNMRFMFGYSEAFNQPIGNWNTSNVTNMFEMFRENPVFNQDLNNWDVSNVTNMQTMFYRCFAFNGAIGNWNVSNVTNMRFMLQETAFNQDISDWQPINLTQADRFMNGKGPEYDPIKLDAIYNKWSLLSLKSNLTISFGNINYTSNGQSGKDTLVNTFGWNVIDGGQI